MTFLFGQFEQFVRKKHVFSRMCENYNIKPETTVEGACLFSHCSKLP
jgi:hypothetical protein